MKGTLHKTESGWHVINMQATLNEPLLQSLPLIDNGDIDGLKLYDSNEGLEVEFEIVDFPVPPTNGPVSNSISKYAKLVDKATRPLTENDAWRTMKEGDITVNFKPMPEFDDPKYPEVKIVCPRCKDIMPCTCNANWDTIWKDFRANKNASYSWALLEYLKDNYNPPTKKQE